MLQIEGAILQPIISFWGISSNDKDVPFTAMGVGRSKKEAKHFAACALIDKLIGVQLADSQNDSAGVGATLTSTSEGGANATGCCDGTENLTWPIQSVGFRRCAWRVVGHHQLKIIFYFSVANNVGARGVHNNIYIAI